MRKLFFPVDCIYVGGGCVILAMHVCYIVGFAIYAFNVCHGVDWSASDFWIQSKATSDLSALRQAEFSPVIVTDSPRELNNPLYAPLCGNGRVDTIKDYEIYFLKETRRPRVSKRSMMGSATFNSASPDFDSMVYNLTLMVDEVCDDGNRKDMDGCSSDCSYIDLWTSSCEV